MKTKTQSKSTCSKDDKYPYFTRSQSKTKKMSGVKRTGLKMTFIKVSNINIAKDYIKEMNQTSPWLMKDGKMMYKDAHGQTCYKYVCPYQYENGSFCGLKPFLPKDSISMKGFCKKHKEYNDN